MRVKLSKLLSAVLALCIVFAGISAFAADATVVTTTNYNYNTHNDGNDGIPSGDKAATMTIVTNVTDVDPGTEITYLVRKPDGTIVYINQDTATASGASFTFTADQAAIFAASAKYGSDAGYAMPTFSFNHGVKYLTQGDVDVQVGDEIALADGSYAFLGTVSGPVTAYGIKIGDAELLAMDCDAEGNFAIVVEGISAEEAASATIIGR